MQPGESYEWQDNDEGVLFTEPSKEKGRRAYRKLELTPPDLELRS